MISIFSALQFRLTDQQLNRLYDIIIHAYAETEKEMWGADYERIDMRNLERCIDRDEMLVAVHEGDVVGGVRYFHLRDNAWSFSLLAADFEKAGLGIGRALVEKVEQIVLAKGGDEMRIEILRPAELKVESKERIAAWYQRMGYGLVKQIPLEALYPEKEALLQAPSIFDCYSKKL